MPTSPARRFGVLLAAGLLAAAIACSGPAGRDKLDLVLVTLDTTRADALGCYGNAAARTPELDRLAAAGTRWTRAITPSPLTLPAHASILTGREPIEHGVRDNGVAVLPAELPTLATTLAEAGWQAGAFVASRVLDRRFGLDRGWSVYDDAMAAERIGEFGYPERDAAAVSAAALAWVASLPPDRPYFLWVHYCDPHAPYEPPDASSAADERSRYAGEVAFTDAQIGRLLAGLPGLPERRLVVIAGDHGEAFGEHGERGHGVLLKEATLHVPLIAAGPGVPAGARVDPPVSLRALSSTVLQLAGVAGDAAAPFGEPLPGLPATAAVRPPAVVYSETLMPATAYGWAALKAATNATHRLVIAPRPELYDLANDPAETRNLFAADATAARELAAALAEYEKRLTGRAAGAAQPDADVSAALRTLGYVSGASEPPETAAAFSADRIDPKDGVAMLAELASAKRRLAAGEVAPALAALTELVRSSPGNPSFLSNLAQAQAAAGRRDEGIATLRRAIALNPGLDLTRLVSAEALFAAGLLAEAEAEYRTAVTFNPRLARAWLGLGELAGRSRVPGEERRVLQEAVSRGTDSAAIHTRLAQLAAADGDGPEADRQLQRALALVPRYVPALLVAGDLAERAGRPEHALARYLDAVQGRPGDAPALLNAGRVALALGRSAQASDLLSRAIAAAPGSPAAQEARRLQASLARAR